jgi:heptosyltransferase-1
MKKVLLIKTSSLGDVVHALPAVTELLQKIPDVELTWVVEESFADIAAAHPGVAHVIPVAIRRWRSNWLANRAEILGIVRQLRSTQYDLIIDSQGLLKSGLIARLAKGVRHGFDRTSARESLASAFYDSSHHIETDLHAIVRQKKLLARVFGYVADEAIDYGLASAFERKKQIMLLHGTTWSSKEWPESYWQKLATVIADDGYRLIVPAGNQRELIRAQSIIQSILASGQSDLLDRVSLSRLIDEMKRCAGVVSVDTGLGHLAPAVGVPVVGIFGATNPSLTGILGDYVNVVVSDHLPCIPCRKRDCQFQIPSDSSSIYPPCYEQTSPEKVWQALQLQIRSKDNKLD